MEGYNGWTNYETWNVALYMQNEPKLYVVAKNLRSYTAFLRVLKRRGSTHTPDGVAWASRKVNRREITDMMKDLREVRHAPVAS